MVVISYLQQQLQVWWLGYGTDDVVCSPPPRSVLHFNLHRVCCGYDKRFNKSRCGGHIFVESSRRYGGDDVVPQQKVGVVTVWYRRCMDGHDMVHQQKVGCITVWYSSIVWDRIQKKKWFKKYSRVSIFSENHGTPSKKSHPMPLSALPPCRFRPDEAHPSF